MPSFSVLDCNEFWSPSGGGVRRYHLQKMEYFRKRSDVHYAFLMPGNEARDEALGGDAVIAHVPAVKVPGNWEYRLVPSAATIRGAILKHRPDVIEVGSPYFLPGKISGIVNSLSANLPPSERPKVVGFWHSDFPVTYVGRFFSRFGALAGRWAEALAWKWARFQYNRMDAVFVPSRVILERLHANGVKNLHYVPLGVDSHNFTPQHRDEARVLDLKAGLPERLTIFFGHRFAEEKGLRTFLKAYPDICRRLGHEPAVVFAGTGPDLDRVQAAVREHKHMRYIGFVRDPADMAAWYASCEMGLALSGWETFGLSILEAMACGQTLVAANQGAAREHIEASDAGLTIPVADAEALADAVETLYRDQAGRDGRAQRAIAYARSLTWDNCFDRELVLYRMLAEKK
jgi:alpha-1,6-mannosyltransferase